MRRLTLAQIVLYFTGMLAGLALFTSLSGPTWAHLTPVFLTLTGVSVLGLFINLIDILNQVLVLGSDKNKISEILRAQIPYQLEVF